MIMKYFNKICHQHLELIRSKVFQLIVNINMRPNLFLHGIEYCQLEPIYWLESIKGLRLAFQQFNVETFISFTANMAVLGSNSTFVCKSFSLAYVGIQMYIVFIWSKKLSAAYWMVTVLKALLFKADISA